MIERFIKELIEETDGVIEIQRNELANYFNCVPSQINYVIDTRFTTERGYYVESRRGGGGHIRIKRISLSRPAGYLMHAINSIGEKLTQQAAEAFINNFIDYDIINTREADIMKAALSDKILNNVSIEQRDSLRAKMLKNMLLSLLVK